MNARFPARREWLLAAAIAVVCGLLIWGLVWQHGRVLATPEAQLARVPTRDAVVLYVDFDGLRRAGLLQMLAGSRVSAEPEYRDFVEKTHFDYTTDLDTALVSFAPSGKYCMLRGHFDWAKLRAYAVQAKGECRRDLCRMEGSTPERNISFVRLQRGLMALAISRDGEAAGGMRQRDADARPIEIPAAPLWVSLPGSALNAGPELPAGTRIFARTLANAQSVTLALAPEGGRFALRMDVRCRTAAEAAALAQVLEKATAVLREMLAREGKTPNPRDLSGVLAAGTFRPAEAQVSGHWPVERGFFEELLRNPS